MQSQREIRSAGLTAAFLAAATSLAYATDHIDGAHAVNAPTVDLTDLYAFKDTHEDRLVLILNAITAAQPWERPAPDAAFDIVIGALAEGTLELMPEDPFRLSCSWTDASAICETSAGSRIEAPLIGAIADPAPLRLFAGRRSDPFVLNGIWAGELALRDKIPAPFDANIIERFNTYALVAEIDIAAVMPAMADRALAIGAEVRDRASGRVLDRIGRPEIANIALQSNTGPDLRDTLNSYPALILPVAFRAEMRARLRENLDRYDAMDPAPFAVDKDALARILADDFLVIDPRLPCAGARYFDLESALLAGTQALQCGGRPLGQDVIDAVYGLMIHGDPTREVADGASTPTRPPGDAFPWLAEPNTGPHALLAALVGRGISDFSAPGRGRTVVLALLAVAALGALVLVGLVLRRRARS